jgi:hypothetical protein
MLGREVNMVPGYRRGARPPTTRGQPTSMPIEFTAIVNKEAIMLMS